MYLNLGYRRRLPISCDATALGGPAVRDVLLVIGPNMRMFWDNVDSNGHSIRITAADGVTEMTWDRQAWNYANRTATLEVQALSCQGNSMHLLWLYFEHVSPSDDSTTFAIGTSINGYLEDRLPMDRVVSVSPERPGGTKPRAQVSKDPADEVDLTWYVSPVLQRLAAKAEGHSDGEELDHVLAVNVYDNVPADVPGMYDESLTRFVVNDRGMLGIRTHLKAGVDPNDYTAQLTLVTTDSKKHHPRCTVKVRQVAA